MVEVEAEVKVKVDLGQWLAEDLEEGMRMTSVDYLMHTLVSVVLDGLVELMAFVPSLAKVA